MPDRIYFDNAATTRLDPRVLDAMRPYLDQCWGNPSSMYVEGRQAREAVDRARAQVATLLGAEPDEIIFTGSGTEADNLALQGVLFQTGLSSSHLVVSTIEHPAILACCRQLEHLGVTVTELPVSREGLVYPADLEAAICPETRLVSVMAANNVVGTIQPIAELASVAQRRGVLFHTDAVQAVGKIPFDVRQQSIDLLSLSGHKLHGPKGIGALYAREGIDLWPLLPGGGQERGGGRARRTWPPSLASAEPAELAAAERADEAARLVGLRNRIIEGIQTNIDNAYLIGDRWRRLPGHICLGFDGQEGEAIKLLLELDSQGIAISSGSAVQREPRRPAFPRTDCPGVRSAESPRLAADFARAVQHDGRGQSILGSVAAGRGFAATDRYAGEGRLASDDTSRGSSQPRRTSSAPRAAPTP